MLLYIDDLFVSSEWRNRGIATQLLAAAVRGGCAQAIGLQVRALVPQQEAARALYNRLGMDPGIAPRVVDVNPLSPNGAVVNLQPLTREVAQALGFSEAATVAACTEYLETETGRLHERLKRVEAEHVLRVSQPNIHSFMRRSREICKEARRHHSRAQDGDGGEISVLWTNASRVYVVVM